MRWGTAVIAVLWLGVTGLPVLAQGTGTGTGTVTGPEAFRDQAVGRTLTYSLPDGGLWGREYWPNRDYTLWQSPDGSCLTCAVSRVGGTLCFDCQDGARSCWRHFDLGDGRFRIVSDTLGEAIGRIEGRQPMACGIPGS